MATAMRRWRGRAPPRRDPAGGAGPWPPRAAEAARGVRARRRPVPGLRTAPDVPGRTPACASGRALRAVEREHPLAIGRCGLDFFVEGLDEDEQRRYFEGQLRLAREFDLPLIVHARRAVDAVIASVKRVGRLRGVVHSFSGSPEQARQRGSWDS